MHIICFSNFQPLGKVEPNLQPLGKVEPNLQPLGKVEPNLQPYHFQKSCANKPLKKV